ncbi:MAG TPA: hypothetical protein VF529_09465 [Solirubrobacteraceae bacterium]|jgi:hypothetical protein
MGSRNPFVVGVAVVVWIVFCASLTLIIGSGAERYPVNREADMDHTMFYSGIACFVGAFLVAMLLRAFGAGREEQESRPGPGPAFLVITPLVALVAGIAIDIAK